MLFGPPDMDEGNTCSSLLTWMRTFDVEPICYTVNDVSDGVAMSCALHHIDPVWFDESFLAKIKTDIGSNWRLKISNLKKVLKAIVDYYQEVLGQSLEADSLPDVALLGEHAHSGEAGKLLQLLLGCAVHCAKRDEHIQTIMTLEESIQHVVMAAIQKLMMRDVDVTTAEPLRDIEAQLQQALNDLGEALQARDEALRQCQDVKLQLTSVEEDRGVLLAENNLLKERLNQPDCSIASTRGTARREPELQRRLEQLQEELFRVEVSREEFRVRCEELEREALLQDQKNRQLLSIAEEAQSMKDEMDVLRHSSDRVTQLEAAVESYRRKLDDLGDLRRQVRELEERNSEQVRSTMLLEEELRRANAVRAQLDAFKEQIQEVQDRASMEARRADKFDFECKKLQERLDTVHKEKERLRVERNSLQEAIDDLRCSQERAKYLGNLPQGSPPARTLDQEMLPQELRQRLLDLQHENRQLRVAQENAENNEIVRLKTLVEDGERQRNELLTENRLLNQRVLQLQSSVESLQNMLQERGVQASDPISISLTKKMEEHREKLTEDGTVLQMKREYIDGLQPKSGTNSPTVEELQAALLKKDKDMKSMEERYRQYLVKARSVIKTLDPKNQPQYHPELQQLKNQLQEKDRIVQALEKECEKTKQDEKLLVSAWYNMGISLPQHGSDWRGTGGATQSFLAQQRRSTSNRRNQSGQSIHGGQR